ncbi:MAG: hypothetical protein QOH20_1130, partial [Mycobacterium sp.]|nr:hypothetical protein [Mycobacterium sp.]
MESSSRSVQASVRRCAGVAVAALMTA